MRCDLHCPPVKAAGSGGLVAVAAVVAWKAWPVIVVAAQVVVGVVALCVAGLAVTGMWRLVERVRRRVVPAELQRAAILAPPRALPVRQPLGLPPAARPVQGAIIDSREVARWNRR